MNGTRTSFDRRVVASGVAALAIAPALGSAAVADENALAKAALAKIAAGRPMQKGRVTITLPELAENGNSVGLTIAVDSPMTAGDYVKTLHVVSEKNPIAEVVKFHLSPRAGRARVSTNIRLASTQTVTAIAEMSDGTLWFGTASVIVTLAACVDGG
ncbi:MAG TPA: SoxY-related AACIE arm protein [Hyphomicrobiaceae bacterium]|nr:SoxY-related AACIE arm protein [Hyphomicrobiaceae bacterium]